jgi:hypothetical protein
MRSVKEQDVGCITWLTKAIRNEILKQKKVEILLGLGQAQVRSLVFIGY